MPTPDEVAAAFGETPRVEPGDIVTHDGQRYVVVDVSGDGDAVLRPPDDEQGELTAAPVGSLTVVGHI